MNIYGPAAMSRRRFLISAGAVGVAGWLAPRGLLGGAPIWDERVAQAEGIVEKIRRAAATGPMSVQQLRGPVHVVIGSGGNVAALPGPDGVLLVDSGIVGRRVTASVGTISKVPIRHVINTHWHFDHTDANEWMHSHRATILAHENTRKHLAATTRVVDWEFTFPPAPSGALPTSVFPTERSLELNGSRIALKHYAPAHTDADISVHFTDVDVLHVGDTWWNGIYPFIDYSTGGSINGTIQATDENLARVAASTVIVPGHGPVGDRAQLTKYRDMLVTVRDRVAALKAHGRAEPDVIAEKPTAAFDATWGGSVIDPGLFTHLVYEGV
jgi:glyoxylase-like metal-dependent hydrolase (beta-lactamase superfamily II)